MKIFKQVLFPALPIALATSAWAQLPPRVLVKQRDPLVGFYCHAVNGIGRPTSNGVGGWACEITSINGAQTQYQESEC